MSTLPRRVTRLLALLAGGLLAANGVVWSTRTAATDRVVVADDPALEATTTVPTTAPPTTTVPAPSTTAAPAAPQRPVDVPADRYAPEPVRQIGMIEIPKIGLVHPIFEGITMRNIDRGPSHWPGTALPGQAGNAVFAGHRVTHSHPFRNIDRLTVNDPVIFDIGGVRTVYYVTGSQIVAPKDTWIVNATPTATATLFACHPPGSARYRYVVRLALDPVPVGPG